ncbi:uncharacterized protein J4E88_003232 [Alternaria novae-zelandiae]|uniref:uncharacterized protein n=1 Tax=Alternaria novae-zelandiae TaxID=430562 RepID=UPI0020C53FC5|nr:uncharacterized protein J4E88_003232 [Alternaria novae-zelandiae]KAI4687641.1 hypothetical protein J4E88_003232 [Alternaria novae-zelandiae]
MDGQDTGALPKPKPKPKRFIPVPPEYRRLTHTTERELIVNEIKINTGCDVIPKWDAGYITQFAIAGQGAGVEKAVRYINHWISNAHIKSKDSSSWAKTPAFDHNKWYYDSIEERERQRKDEFKGKAPEVSKGEMPLASIIVCWPEDLLNEGVTPRDVFNNKLEALNAIRTQNERYKAARDIARIEAAEAHLMTMIDKVKADAMGLQHLINIILDKKEGLEVVLEEADAWWPNLYVNHKRELQTSADLFRSTSVKIESYLASSPKFGKDIFLKSINGPVAVDIKKWLADDALGSQILGALCIANEFLEPTKSSAYFGYTPKSLQGTRPMFRGTWVFTDPSSVVAPPREPVAVRHAGRPKAPPQAPASTTTPSAAPQSELIVVQVDWTDDEEGLYEKTTTRFYKIDQGRKTPKKNMDINLLELGESRGWHFALESLIPVAAKSISPVITGFADRVKMRPNHDYRSTESFAEWDQTPTVKKHLRNGRLETIYSFGIKQTCYKVEATCMWYPGQRLPVWGLCVRHSEWATHLAELERLPVGRKADWGHTVATFLPDDGQSCYSSAVEDEDFGMRNLDLGPGVEAPPRDGIRILMDKLLQLSAIVSSVTDMGGVAI